mmetsp:Transcript_29789/g.48504  ORF Transcript_29789/g.48504 Transcript_29789/m.48504 type:complete len:133 (-) Transcript_29789:265-663(-)
MLAISATQDALDKFEDFKLKKKLAYVIFSIQGSDIKVESELAKDGDEDAYVGAFVDAIKSTGDARYGVVDCNHKVCFVSWVPDTCKAQNKMKYATSKEGFASSLQGINVKIQATDDGELSKAIIQEKCKSNV